VTASCHGSAAAGAATLAVRDRPVVALVGASNVGKTTLFNALSGARQSIGNWPGTTVEVARAEWQPRGRPGHPPLAVLDLPGTASLVPLSPDEALTRELLVEAPPLDRPDLVVAVVDAAGLARSLYLLAQLREHPLRLVVAVTMADVAARRGIRLDMDGLSRAVGAPAVVVDPRRRDRRPPWATWCSRRWPVPCRQAVPAASCPTPASTRAPRIRSPRMTSGSRGCRA